MSKNVVGREEKGKRRKTRSRSFNRSISAFGGACNAAASHEEQEEHASATREKTNKEKEKTP